MTSGDDQAILAREGRLREAGYREDEMLDKAELRLANKQ